MSRKSPNRVSRYLAEVLGLHMSFAPYAKAPDLPHVLQDAYVFHEAELLGRHFLTLTPQNEQPSPASLEKQLVWLKEKTGLRGIVVLSALPAHTRRRLIERRIPFVVPDSQLYLPDLGIVLREQTPGAKRRMKYLSPASHVFVLAACLGRLSPSGPLSATALAGVFGYTKMTLSRSLEELRRLDLVHDDGDRRSASTRFRHVGRELWESARPFLRSPVKRRIYLEEPPGGPALPAGEFALSGQTQLSTPPQTTWALGTADWKEMQAHRSFRMLSDAAGDTAPFELEIWSYPPGRLSDGPHVDPLSLALSLSDQTDDRVQIAIDDLLKRVW